MAERRFFASRNTIAPNLRPRYKGKAASDIALRAHDNNRQYEKSRGNALSSLPSELIWMILQLLLWFPKNPHLLQLYIRASNEFPIDDDDYLLASIADLIREKFPKTYFQILDKSAQGERVDAEDDDKSADSNDALGEELIERMAGAEIDPVKVIAGILRNCEKLDTEAEERIKQVDTDPIKLVDLLSTLLDVREPMAIPREHYEKIEKHTNTLKAMAKHIRREIVIVALGVNATYKHCEQDK
ncbi:MAG: hypothetical protein L6R42_002189 [Xanthoria sp. 1 TBL-2021]|nr:MAG: hypothetical protein L6R42_002189 [Xanthoria sp. 1 TBL-2021]